MPNHVHLLIEKAPWEDPRQIIKAVKAFTARRPTPPRPPVVATVILRRLAGIQPPCHLRAGSDYARNSIAHPRHTTSPAIGLHAPPYAPGHLAPPCRSQSGLRWHWAGIGPAPNNQDSPRPGFAAPSSSIERSARPPYPLSSESSCATTTCEARRLPGRLSKRTETIRPSEHAYAGRRQPASAAYATSIPTFSVHARGPTPGVRRVPSVSSPSMSFTYHYPQIGDSSVWRSTRLVRGQDSCGRPCGDFHSSTASRPFELIHTAPVCARSPRDVGND
jgi:hypothetical protein